MTDCAGVDRSLSRLVADRSGQRSGRRPDAAVDAFERALTRKPVRADLLEIYQTLRRVHQRARRADKALAVWARLEASFPDDTRVREQIAAAFAEEDQPAQALDLLGQYADAPISTDGSSAAALIQIARLVMPDDDATSVRLIKRG